VCCVVREYEQNRRAEKSGPQPAVLHLGQTLISRIAVFSPLLSFSLLVPFSFPLQSFIAEEKPEWEVKGDRIYFDLSTAKKVEVPSLRLIKETLTYANELDRIV
jgi:hypothetical protein